MSNTISGFTPIYRGAITRNETGKVNVHPVSYQLHGLTIAANVYTPAGYHAGGKYPALVVAHPNGGVKEQVAGLYAQHLAEQGYITVTADAAYQGASGGLPRSGAGAAISHCQVARTCGATMNLRIVVS